SAWHSVDLHTSFSTLFGMSGITIYVPLTISFFFFTHTATSEIYTLSLHDALPISELERVVPAPAPTGGTEDEALPDWPPPVGAGDRKSRRLNSSHSEISYAVFCFKKKNKN